MKLLSDLIICSSQCYPDTAHIFNIPYIPCNSKEMFLLKFHTEENYTFMLNNHIAGFYWSYRFITIFLVFQRILQWYGLNIFTVLFHL